MISFQEMENIGNTKCNFLILKINSCMQDLMDALN